MTRRDELAALAARIVRCRRCPRLVRHREAVALAGKPEFRGWKYWGKPVSGFGDPGARLLIVGLAPAAHGANRTGRMFTGDSSGDWLYEALHRFGFATQPTSESRDDGLALHDCFITASARCAPPANRPTQAELDACAPFLVQEIALLDQIRVTLVLGHVAHRQWLKAASWWGRLPPGERPRFRHAAVHALPDQRWLLCSYHPSRQNTNTGRLTRQMWYGVFEMARELVER